VIKLKRLSLALVLTAFAGEVSASEFARLSVLSVVQREASLSTAYSADTLETRYSLRTIGTRTPWSKGEEIVYRGIPLADVLKENRLLEQSQDIVASAANGYSAILSIQDVEDFQPILAVQRSCGESDARRIHCEKGTFIPLGINDFGPFLLVWPVSSGSGRAASLDNSKWIWFLTGIRAVD